MSTDPITYPIRTLQDIWNLPSHEAMETCLSEITKIMLTARATYDLIHAGAENKAGKNRPVATVWPEFIDWIDDGKGELGVDYRFDTGETLLSQKITRHE